MEIQKDEIMVTDEEFQELKERVEKLEELNKVLQKLQESKVEIKNASVKSIEINVDEISFIKRLGSVLDKCLALLNYVFEKDPQNSGLTSDEIETILKEKFGLPVTLENISMSLKNVTGTYVTREKIKEKVIKYRYKILQKGKEYIEKKISELSETSN